ncbi:RHS repeat-associated core domain-containing protein [Pseudomonas sp. RIT623]|uniref:RHS repeat-associated core domain-containing protein n=1 Tax=Pseudomonas sp. RIT623 TaxID=2559075 RepID=UPI00106F3DA8|nr:RHS repeat-associated core domain-containing protein [Pseudomonas sp. RIT623]TFF42755.1 type IV secretion protein Rhs [Pseudomonas sp. RIT623]
MDDSLHAARQGDLILHPPLMAELVSALSEAVIYAAATAAVAAAIAGTVVAVVGTGGAAATLTPLIAGALVSAASMLPTGNEKSIGERITDFSDWIGNSMFAPEPYGTIETGSPNTRVNGMRAARAAGVSTGPATAGSGEPAAEPSVLETVGAYAMAAGTLLLPVLGMASAIHDIFNPPVTTPADPNTDPRPHDKAVCSKHPPMPEQFVAQGSGKVFINGQPAARVGDKTTCDGPIGMTFSPNVRIGGKTMTVRDIRDGKSALAKVFGLVAGMLIARKGTPKSGRACTIGNPVLPSTGAKLQEGAQDVDFDLPALVPIEWARTYHSADLRDDGLFGRGWSVPYEVRIERVAHPEGGELWIYVDEVGNRLELGQLQPGSAFVSMLDGLAFFHQDAGITVVEDIHAGRYQVFQTDPVQPRRSRLVKLGDRNLNELLLFYDDEGRLQFLGDTFGRTFIELRYADSRSRRVVDIQRLYLQPGERFEVERRETLVSYRYSAGQQLTAVLDAQAQVVRQFSYDDNGLMASHTLPSGAVRHYQWARFEVPIQKPQVSYPEDGRYRMPSLLEPQAEHEWRVVRHWGSDGQEYRFEYDLARGLTQVIDGLGRENHYYWGPHHEIYRHIDPLGRIWQEDLPGGMPLRLIDPQGGEWHYSYDGLGRLIASRDPLGRIESITYTDHWALPLAITDRGGHTTRRSYDRHGNLLGERDPLGHQTHYRYDRQGRLVQVTDALGKQRHLHWNDQGQLLDHRDCSGQQTRYRYDARGNLCETLNARDEREQFRHDRRGYLVEYEAADGRVDRYQRDAAGQVVSHTDPGNNVTRWHYDGSGRLLQRTDALGMTVRLSYDAYGRLQQLTNPNDEHYRFEWDALDRQVSQQNLDGSGLSFEYGVTDAVRTVWHHPSAEVEPPLTTTAPTANSMAQRLDYEHDAAGRLLRKRSADGVTDYAYDAADNLVSITFSNTAGERQQLNFRHDALGQLLAESHPEGELRYSHDELGNLQTLTLPDNRRINHLYYGSGHLHQLNLDGKLICDFERDSLHEEVLRTQGRLQTRTRRDNAGRIIQRAQYLGTATAAELPLLARDYHYDASDNLVAQVVTDYPGASHGTGRQRSTHYAYGPTQRIHAAWHRELGQTNGLVEAYAYDHAGNLQDTRDTGTSARHDRVHAHQDCRYRYDRFGRLSEKRSGRHLTQRFEYDAEQRLIRVHQQRGPVRERVEFAYDPLGRRTGKALYREGNAEAISQTRFHWQGVRLLQEVQDGKPSLYLYADADSHVPVARIDGVPGSEEVFYFHTNLAGLAEQLTDAEGTTVWRAAHEVWGRFIDEWRHPGQSRQQNLHFAGQYVDRETGLHYNTFRFYDPDIGRYTQPDPINLQGGLNVYLYAPNPLAWIDPLGWCKIANKISGDLREAKIHKILKAMFGKKNVLKQRHLRNADGKIVSLVDDAIEIGKVKGSRILDFVVKTKDGRWRAIEVTSGTAPKGVQRAKEATIRANGGTYVRIPGSKKVVEVDDMSRIIRID